MQHYTCLQRIRWTSLPARARNQSINQFSADRKFGKNKHKSWEWQLGPPYISRLCPHPNSGAIGQPATHSAACTSNLADSVSSASSCAISSVGTATVSTTRLLPRLPRKPAIARPPKAIRPRRAGPANVAARPRRKPPTAPVAVTSLSELEYFCIVAGTLPAGMRHKQPSTVAPAGHLTQPLDSQRPQGSTVGQVAQSPATTEGTVEGGVMGSPLVSMKLCMRPVSECVRKWQWKTNLPANRVSWVPMLSAAGPASKHCLSVTEPMGGIMTVSLQWLLKAGL
mmetsp:Transcript_68022/g.192272  ORF Transcript_68022/g.192272 Transcript_68022/m.192272 type:complete len:282 (+) Transcript_68022:66-911(+)